MAVDILEQSDTYPQSTDEESFQTELTPSQVCLRQNDDVVTGRVRGQVEEGRTRLFLEMGKNGQAMDFED